MASYLPPESDDTIFNIENFIDAETTTLTIATGDLRYLKLTGGIMTGSTLFNSNLTASNGVIFTDSGFTSTMETGTLSGDIDLTLPSSTGTLALISDIPTNSTYVDLSSAQTISGIKTFSADPLFSNGSFTGSFLPVNLTVDRTYTMPNSSGTLSLTSDLTGGVTDLSVLTCEVGNGTFTNPTLGFVSRGDTGIYLQNPPTNDNIGFSVSGTESLVIGDSQVLNIDGSILDSGASSTSTPSISFLNDSELGFFRNGSKSLGLALGVREPTTVFGTSYLTFTDANLISSQIEMSDGVNTLFMSHTGFNYLTNTSGYKCGVSNLRAFMENPSAVSFIHVNSNNTIDLTASSGFSFNGGNDITTFDADVWTPVYSNLSNIDSQATVDARYHIINNLVTCYITLEINLTVAGNYSFDVTNPIATTSGSVAPCGRIQRNTNGSRDNSGSVIGATSSSTLARVIAESTNAATTDYNIVYTYSLIGT